MTLGFLNKDILYLANLGEGNVFLQRNGKVGQILTSGENCSGKVTAGDILLFSSKTFLHCVDKQKQQELLRAGEITDIAEEIYVQLLASANSLGAAGLLLELEDRETGSAFETSYQAPQKPDYKSIFKEKWQSMMSSWRQKRENLLEDGEEAKSKKTLLTIAVVLILLLIASIFLNINHSQSTNKKTLLKQTVDLVSHQYDEAVSLIDLNPGRARVLLSDSKLSLSQILKEFPKNSNEYKEVNDWLAKIAAQELVAYKIFKLTTVPVFFDISLIKNAGAGTKISLHQMTAVILDSKNKVAYSLALDTKKADIIAGSETVKDAQTISVHGKSAYVLTGEGIVRIDIPAKTAQTVVRADKDWGEIGELVAFAGNIYLMDRKNNAIWKYIVQENGFSPRSSYLNPDVRVNFSNAKKMIIDGSVWVLATPVTLSKFTSGHGDTFSVKGLADTISYDGIFTSDEDKNVYILDKHALRILVFDKDGEYQSQYQWDELKNTDDFVVSEEEQKIFLLLGSKIYAIDLK